MKVKVLAHTGHIVIIPDKPEEGIHDRWWPAGGQRFGSVLGDTKNNLGVSQEALDLMYQIEVGRDAIGDIDWWACNDGTWAFSWFGAMYRIINPDNSVSARGFQPNVQQCTLIPNDVPEDVKDDVERAIKDPEMAAYRDPFCIEDYPDDPEDE